MPTVPKIWGGRRICKRHLCDRPVYWRTRRCNPPARPKSVMKSKIRGEVQIWHSSRRLKHRLKFVDRLDGLRSSAQTSFAGRRRFLQSDRALIYQSATEARFKSLKLTYL